MRNYAVIPFLLLKHHFISDNFIQNFFSLVSVSEYLANVSSS